jgi:hypothetical protein
LIAALTTAMTMEAISRPIARSQVSNIPWPVAHATRTEWPEWTEVDGHGRRIFPCSRILEEPLLVEAPPTVRRKRVTSKK